uniref:CYP4BE1 n=1 Tax=Ips paraconfusus TaxID=89938 RepID=A1BPS0_9CUCU|nr:CYP4BE1 [Ips paraconfusus]
MIKAWLGPVPILFVVDPDSAKVILESNTLITKSSFYDKVADWIGTGLLISTNEKWQSRRKLLTPAFHFNILKGYTEVMVKEGEVFVDQLDKLADTGREFNLYPYVKRCALDIICETAMGTHINAQIGMNSEYVDAVTRVSDLTWTYIRFPFFWIKPIWYASSYGFEFDRLVKLTNDFTRKVINERREALREEGILESGPKISTKQRMAFLDLLLMHQAASNLNDEDIREEVDTFMFEGHDTTAAGMAFAIWLIGQNAEAQAKVHAEVDSIFGDSSRPPEEADVTKLVYLERCIKESLRLFPSVPLFARRLTHDITIKDTVLPEGLNLILAPLATHRDPEQYERPWEFYPDHFTQEAIAKRHPYAYFPFSAGPRNCIGQKFALSEEKIVLSWFFRRFRVESSEPMPGNRPLPELILKPSDGVLCKIYRRRH